MSSAVAQYTSSQSTTLVMSQAATFALATTTGNALVVCASGQNQTGFPPSNLSIGDTSAATWTQISNVNGWDSGGADVVMWYARNITGTGSHTVTISSDANTLITVVAFELSGVLTTASLLGQHNTNSDPSSSSITTPSLATNSGSLLLACATNNGGGGTTGGLMTPGGSFTTGPHFDNGSYSPLATEYIENAASGSYGANFSMTTANGWGAIFAEFKSPGAVYNASASIAGTGAVTATGKLAHVGFTTIAGSGSVSGTASLNYFAGAAVSGTGAVTGTSAVAHVATATAGGTGGVTGTAMTIYGLGASISGAGGVSATSRLDYFASAAIAGAGSPSGNARLDYVGSASITGAGTAAAQSRVVHVGTAGAAGVGGGSGTPALSFAATAIVIGTGGTSATGHTSWALSSSPSATSALSASLVRVRTLAASPHATSALTATAAREGGLNALLHATSSFPAALYVSVTAQPTGVIRITTQKTAASRCLTVKGCQPPADPTYACSLLKSNRKGCCQMIYINGANLAAVTACDIRTTSELG